MLHVVAERSRSIDRCLDLFVLYHLEGFCQRVDTADLSAVLLADFLISRTDGVRRCLALEIIKGMDVVIVETSNLNRAVIGIRRRKIIGLSSFRSNVHAVNHQVISSGIHAGKQTVPGSFNNFDFDS